MSGTTIRERTEALVLGHLQELGIEYRRTDTGVVTVACGTTVVYISIAEFQGHGIVHLVAPVLEEFSANGNQLATLMALNSQLVFGRFCHDSDAGRITVEYDLFGDTLDEQELHTGVRAVGHIADEWDERLQQTFGGRRPLID